MEDRYEFDAVIQSHADMDAAFVEIPFDVEATFGVRGRAPVLASFDGVDYRGSLVKMGHHCHLIGLTKAVRARIGKGPGERVRVVISRDTASRVVAIPDDLRGLLDGNKAAKAAFEALSYSHKKEYVDWLTAAKKDETHLRRLEKLRAKLTGD
jgi:hypothetical protein